MQWDFKVVLTQNDVDLDGADRLYARCDDSTLITENGETFLEFDREADSLHAAIQSAVTDIRAAGFDVARVEMGPEALECVSNVS